VTRVLIVEDDADFREFMAIGLRRSGHTVTVASSGRSVTEDELGSPPDTPFDVIVTDILMPEVDGIEVIRAAKATRPACRIVAISGGGGLNGPDVYLSLANVFGADATLAKPFNITDLCAAIAGEAR
jgi:two-component system, chemotaxis family, chemotaxis protein CheY